MQLWSHGDLDSEFEQRLDRILAVLCPDWSPPDVPDTYRDGERLRAYRRSCAKRLQVAGQLDARPDAASALAGQVLDAIACDEDVSFNRHLIHPMLHAVGRRRVQRYLISVIDDEVAHKKVCAVRAWYWSQVSLAYDSVRGLA